MQHLWQGQLEVDIADMKNSPKKPIILFLLPIVTPEMGYWKGGVMLINVGLKFLQLGADLQLVFPLEEVDPARMGEIVDIGNEIPCTADRWLTKQAVQVSLN
jgi:hypothetical protein